MCIRDRTPYLSLFEGAAPGINALSSFRAQQLLPQLQAIHDKINGIHARFVHVAVFDGQPDEATAARVAALLSYGEPFEAPAVKAAAAVVVTPRIGTVSPWASKATDIAHNCGLALHRVERVTEYVLTFKTGLLAGKPSLSQAQREQIGLLLHDRMTESVMYSRDQLARLFTCLLYTSDAADE